VKIRWSVLAIERVAEIAEYIQRDNPMAAEKWVESVFQVVGQLAQFPESGRIIPEIKQSHFREIIHGHYRVIYRLEEKQISILTIRHGKQILPVDEIMDE
jgi:toxin ParE1/3/4